MRKKIRVDDVRPGDTVVDDTYGSETITGRYSTRTTVHLRTAEGGDEEWTGAPDSTITVDR